VLVCSIKIRLRPCGWRRWQRNVVSGCGTTNEYLGRQRQCAAAVRSAACFRWRDRTGLAAVDWLRALGVPLFSV